MNEFMLASLKKATDEKIDPHWDSVVLLMRGNGNVSDYSSRGRAMTQIGAVAKNHLGPFPNTLSLYNSNAAAMVTTPADAEFGIPAGMDFTLEFWSKIKIVANSMMLGQVATGTALRFGMSNGLIVLRGGVGGVEYSSTFAATANAYSHLACSRKDGILRFFIHGDLAGEYTTNIEYTINTTQQFGVSCLGQSQTQTFNQQEYAEVRFTRGIGRYTESFKPRSSPFPTNVLA